jgi:hypothetical protein
MRPTAIEVMDAVIATFDEQIAPNVSGELAQSLSLTMSNLLRNVRLRMELEAPALAEDNADLFAVLQQVEAYARTRADMQPLLGGRFQEAIAQPPRAEAFLQNVTAEAEALRWALSDAIERLQAVRSARGDEPDYKALRENIRTYLERSLGREAPWIEKAFTGPRR